MRSPRARAASGRGSSAEMALSIRAQAVSLLLACALGAALGLTYDVLRALRRRGRDTPWDILFCLLAALSAFLFAMHAENGLYGTGELLLSLAGLLLYFELLSPLCLPLFSAWLEKIRVFWIITQNFAKKVAFSAKKLFSNEGK